MDFACRAISGSDFRSGVTSGLTEHPRLRNFRLLKRCLLLSNPEGALQELFHHFPHLS
jgi:hypothetical protein